MRKKKKQKKTGKKKERKKGRRAFAISAFGIFSQRFQP